MPMALLQLHDMDYVELQEVNESLSGPASVIGPHVKALHIEGIVELPLQGDHRLRVRCSKLCRTLFGNHNLRVLTVHHYLVGADYVWGNTLDVVRAAKSLLGGIAHCAKYP